MLTYCVVAVVERERRVVIFLSLLCDAAQSIAYSPIYRPFEKKLDREKLILYTQVHDQLGCFVVSCARRSGDVCCRIESYALCFVPPLSACIDRTSVWSA